MSDPQYIYTDHDMTDKLDAAYVEALIEKYSEFPELTSTVTDDMDDFGPAIDYDEMFPDFYDDYRPE